MNDAVAMGCFDGVRDFRAKSQQTRKRQWLLADEVREAFTRNIFENDEITVALRLKVVNNRNVRMIQLRERQGFAPHSRAASSIFPRIGAQDFEGNFALQVFVVGAIHHAHPALSELLEDTEMA